MASREQLNEINKARAGNAAAQVSLAKRYLSGEPGLAKNETTALFWLERAAQQGSLDACVVMGSQITVETAQHSSAHDLLNHYKRAFSAGIDAAGLTFAELVLTQSNQTPELLREAQSILQILAEKNVARAQWLLVTSFNMNQLSSKKQGRESITSYDDASLPHSFSEITEKKLADWATGAGIGGIPEARLVLAESAWANNDYQAFLQWTSPEVEHISQHSLLKRKNVDTSATRALPLSGFRKELLYRFAVCLCKISAKESDKAVHYLELAASEGHSLAQLSLGLWLAKMDSQIVTVPSHPKRASFEQAIDWLTRAGDQGLATPWFALSKIYLKAEFVGRSIAEAEHFLKRAAELDHCDAQLELGTRAWRMRHKSIDSDLTAAFWLQKAARQGCKEAEGMLAKVAPLPRKSGWAMEILSLLTSQAMKADPFLTARIELAALFGLSKVEALWLDIHEADQGHCLVVDVTKHARNNKRRLISLLNVEERQVIDRIKVLFQGIVCNEDGPEGDYRRRLYRLNKLL